MYREWLLRWDLNEAGGRFCVRGFDNISVLHVTVAIFIIFSIIWLSSSG